jgi:hypothetical protein
MSDACVDMWGGAGCRHRCDPIKRGDDNMRTQAWDMAPGALYSLMALFSTLLLFEDRGLA